MNYQSPTMQILLVPVCDLFTLSYGSTGQDVEIYFGIDPSQVRK